MNKETKSKDKDKDKDVKTTATVGKAEKEAPEQAEKPERSGALFNSDELFSEFEVKAEQGPETKKKKRGRPSKKEKFEKEQEKVEMTAVLVAPIINFLSEFLSNRLGEKWRMTQAEVKEGAKVTTAVLNRYMPNFDDKAELLAFGMFWSGYVLTRSTKK